MPSQYPTVSQTVQEAIGMLGGSVTPEPIQDSYDSADAALKILQESDGSWKAEVANGVGEVVGLTVGATMAAVTLAAIHLVRRIPVLGPTFGLVILYDGAFATVQLKKNTTSYTSQATLNGLNYFFPDELTPSQQTALNSLSNNIDAFSINPNVFTGSSITVINNPNGGSQFEFLNPADGILKETKYYTGLDGTGWNTKNYINLLDGTSLFEDFSTGPSGGGFGGIGTGWQFAPDGSLANPHTIFQGSDALPSPNDGAALQSFKDAAGATSFSAANDNGLQWKQAA